MFEYIVFVRLWLLAVLGTPQDEEVFRDYIEEHLEVSRHYYDLSLDSMQTFILGNEPRALNSAQCPGWITVPCSPPGNKHTFMCVYASDVLAEKISS